MTEEHWTSSYHIISYTLDKKTKGFGHWISFDEITVILDDMGQAFMIDETNKNTVQVSHFINIYLEQAISRKTD